MLSYFSCHPNVQVHLHILHPQVAKKERVRLDLPLWKGAGGRAFDLYLCGVERSLGKDKVACAPQTLARKER